MPTINPRNLRTLRDQRGWSLEVLATRAGVDRGTISRIETGRQSGRRRTTIERLAAALEVDPGKLTGSDLQPPESAADTVLTSACTIRIGNDARNALSLVAARYDLSPIRLVELAPLLFLWAAEESLRRRENRLDELAAKVADIEDSFAFGHLSEDLTHNWRGDEVFDQERRSIAKRDIFGLTIDGESSLSSYEESEHNPMALFLAELAASLGGLVQFEGWTPLWSGAGYTLGRDEALALCGGDERAAEHIVNGYAPLHEMPRAVREGGTAAVAEWATGKADEFFDRLAVDMDL